MIVINPIVSGGLSSSKLALATATAEDVVEGKTFYAGDKVIKAGTRSNIKYESGTGIVSYMGNATSTHTLGFVPKYIWVEYRHPYRKYWVLEFYDNGSWTVYTADGYEQTYGVASLSDRLLKIENASATEIMSYSYYAVSP